MKRLIVFSITVGLVALLFFPFTKSHAIEILYDATDLVDVSPGEDLWQYSYHISDHTFAMDEGFTIYFDHLLYGALDPFPVAPNADWDVVTWDPDASIPDDGAYDALAWVDGASLADPFEVSFVWLGTSTPGSQYFELYDDAWNTVGSGGTAPVPEPATLLLVSSGLLGLAAFRKKAKKSAT